MAVVLITNAPRPHDGVEAQLATLGVPDGAWDRVVTSGDVTRDLIGAGPRKVFHLGPDRDFSLYDGLDIDLVEEFEASSVVCTGLFDDETETPDDYREMLARLRARNLPFICANPDIVVERGDRLIWCAGALARDYAQLGGRTLIAGKPHAPIYEAALKAAGEVLGREIGRSEVLAIGDGMLTDIKGAADNGIDALYVSGGIHARDYGHPDNPEPEQLAAFLDRHGVPARRRDAEAAMTTRSFQHITGERRCSTEACAAAWWRSAISTACIAATRPCSSARSTRRNGAARRRWC